MKSIEDVLKDREKVHGKYSTHSVVSQRLKYLIRSQDIFDGLPYSQRESLEMICHKIARILNSTDDNFDSWFDIAGYSMLIVNELERGRNDKERSY